MLLKFCTQAALSKMVAEKMHTLVVSKVDFQCAIGTVCCLSVNFKFYIIYSFDCFLVHSASVFYIYFFSIIYSALRRLKYLYLLTNLIAHFDVKCYALDYMLLLCSFLLLLFNFYMSSGSFTSNVFDHTYHSPAVFAEAKRAIWHSVAYESTRNRLLMHV